MDLNILLSSAGRRGELVQILQDTVVRLDRTGGVYCVDRSPLSAAGQIADGFDLVPNIADPDFVPALLEICQRRRISHLIPTIDTELPVLAQHREEFLAAGVNVWVSSPETIAIARDKRLTNRWLGENGFPAPRQADLEAELATPRLTYPVIAKPAGGSSSVGLAVVDSPDHLQRLNPALDYVLEEMATGHEVTVDVWVDAAGLCRVAVPRRRLETRAGEVSKAVTVRNRDLINMVTKLASSLPGARGVMNVQVFVDGDKFSVIEINARFGGGFPLSWAAEALMPVWAIQDAEGNQDLGPLDAWTDQLVMLRYDQGVYSASGELTP